MHEVYFRKNSVGYLIIWHPGGCVKFSCWLPMDLFWLCFGRNGAFSNLHDLLLKSYDFMCYFCKSHRTLVNEYDKRLHERTHRMERRTRKRTFSVYQPVRKETSVHKFFLLEEMKEEQDNCRNSEDRFPAV